MSKFFDLHDINTLFLRWLDLGVEVRRLTKIAGAVTVAHKVICRRPATGILRMGSIFKLNLNLFFQAAIFQVPTNQSQGSQLCTAQGAWRRGGGGISKAKEEEDKQELSNFSTSLIIIHPH